MPEQPEELKAEIAEEATGTEVSPGTAANSGPIATDVLVAGGESKWVEFKASSCFDRESGNRNKDLEFSIAKTIAGFANAHGGTLLIGVNDGGEAVGLKDDYRLADQKRQDRDGYENWLTTMLAEVLGKVATSYLTITFTDIGGQDVCRVDMEPASSPIFMRGQRSAGDLYVRLNNSSRLLTTADALDYVGSHWR